MKTREWYGIDPKERWRIMQEHIRVGREYPSIDLNTSYSFGLDDQEFVVAFEGDEPAVFLDLVQRLRTTEASAYTKRDTPTFTCMAMSVERALNALDGAAVRVDGVTISRLSLALEARLALVSSSSSPRIAASTSRSISEGLRRTSWKCSSSSSPCHLAITIVATALPMRSSARGPRS